MDSKRASDRDTLSLCAGERQRESERYRENEKNVTKNGNQNMPTATKNFLIFLSCLLKNPNTKIYLEGKYRNDLNWIFSSFLSLCSSSNSLVARMPLPSFLISFHLYPHLIFWQLARFILASRVLHLSNSGAPSSLIATLPHCLTLPISLYLHVCVVCANGRRVLHHSIFVWYFKIDLTLAQNVVKR